MKARTLSILLLLSATCTLHAQQVWTPAQQIDRATPSPDGQSDVVAAVSDSGLLAVGWIEYFSDWRAIVLETSSDGGRSWSGAAMPDSGWGTVRILRDMAFDHAGTLWVLWTSYPMGGPDYPCTLHLARAREGGRVLEEALAVPEAGGIFFESKLAVDPSNNLYLLWDGTSGLTLTRMEAAAGSGLPWKRQDTTVPQDSLLADVYTDLQVGPDYTIYCLWTGAHYSDLGKRRAINYCTVSVDSGGTMLPKVPLDGVSNILSDSGVVQSRPAGTVDPRTGYFYSAFDCYLETGPFFIQVSQTTNRSATFASLGSASDTAHNDFASISISTDGALHIAYNGEAGLIRYTRSRDSGASFETPFVLSNGYRPFLQAGPRGELYMFFRAPAPGGGTRIMFSRLETPDAVAESVLPPRKFLLEQNFPNPFNPTTIIRYQLPVASQVHLAVYDLLGRKVGVLVDGPQSPGAHEATFHAHGLASGVYLYRLETKADSATRRLLLLR